MTILIVFCPCALVIATPAAVLPFDSLTPDEILARAAVCEAQSEHPWPGGRLVSAEMVLLGFIAAHMAMMRHGTTTGHGLTTHERWQQFFREQRLTVVYSSFSRYWLLSRRDAVCRKPLA